MRVAVQLGHGIQHVQKIMLACGVTLRFDAYRMISPRDTRLALTVEGLQGR